MRYLIGGLMALVLAACDLGTSPTASSRELLAAIRESPITYGLDADQRPVGFEYELLEGFAREQGLELKLEVVPSDVDLYRRLQSGKVQLAAGWLSTPPASYHVRASRPYFTSRMAVVQHEAALPLDAVEKLAGQAVAVAAGSRLAAQLQELRRTLPQLTVVEHPDPHGTDLLRQVAEQKIGVAVIDAPLFAIAQNSYPELHSPTLIGDEMPISWLFPARGSEELQAKADAYLERIEKDGTLARLKDRYFGHIKRVNSAAAVDFLTRVRTVLPKYQRLFKQAQIRTGIDWRLLAALAYQESQWDPLATSPTNVRGMMMLTEDTADRLNVSDRLDAKESILAGADYLATLREQLPASVQEPDRTWMAIAAYNLGMGHLNGGRAIALKVKADPDVWYEMKRVLPLMARPEYYARLKSGRARGGEAVIMVENIRAFYDILKLHLPAYDPLPKATPALEDKALEKPRGRPHTMAEAFQRAAEDPGLKPPRQRPAEMTSSPPMYGRKTAGISTLPSAR